MQQVVSPMTVYTVIGYITNAILTFEPLQIRSSLSGGPQITSVFFNADRKTELEYEDAEVSDLSTKRTFSNIQKVFAGSNCHSESIEFAFRI